MKTKLQFLLFAVFLFSFATIQAQTLGEFKPQDGGYKAKNVTDGSKKMYVASFTINFEIYKEAVDEKKAGGFGRTVKNAAKAKAAGPPPITATRLPVFFSRGIFRSILLVMHQSATNRFR